MDRPDHPHAHHKRILKRIAALFGAVLAAAAMLFLSVDGLARAQEESYRVTAITLSGGSVYGVSVGAADCTWTGSQFACSNDHTSGTGSKYSGISGLTINSSIALTERAGIAISIVYTKSAYAEYYSVFSEAYSTQMFRNNSGPGTFDRVHCIAHEPYWDALPGSLPSTAAVQLLLADDGVDCDTVIYRNIQWISDFYLGVRSREVAWSFDISEIGIIHLGDDGDDGDDGGGYGQIITGDVEYAGGYCNLTVTEVISDGEPITQTTTYTRPANLLSNWSFESAAGPMPAAWNTVINGAFQNVPGVWWVSSATYANSGSRSVSNVADYMAVQSLPLYSAGNYVAGFYARCVDGDCDPVQARWDGTVVVASLSMSTTYQAYSGTHVTGGGGASFAVDLTLGGNVYVDDVFVYPANEDGSVNCDPAFFAPPDEEPGGSAPPDCVVDPLTNQCIWAPTGPAGAVCYHCAYPSTAAGVQLWLAWLGCVIRNLFSCSLRVWLFELSNSLRGIMATLNMTVNWVNGNAQRAVNYGHANITSFLQFLIDFWLAYGAFLAASPRQVVVIVQTTVNQIDQGFDWLSLIVQLIRLLFDLFISILGALYNGMVAILNMLIHAARSIYQAFTAPPFDLQTDFVDEGLGPTASGGIPAAANTSAAIARLLMALALIDVSITDYHAWPVLYTVAGIVGLTTIIWVLKEWKDDILPI